MCIRDSRYMKMEKLLENKISRRFKVRRLEINDFGLSLIHILLALQTVTGITLLQVQPMVSFLIRTARNSLLPVSYTHLDVYKRQL